MINTYASLHNHTYYSNIRLTDAINKPEDLVEKADELGISALAITDHESLSGWIKTLEYFNKNKDDFKHLKKLILGNEIYLVHEKDMKQFEKSNEKGQYYHFILNAKDKQGYNFLLKQSSEAWRNSHYYRGMQRTPTTYEWLKEHKSEFQGHIVASTACIGGVLPQKILEYHDNPTEQNKQKIIDELMMLIDLFGKDDLYVELQPNTEGEQPIVNYYLTELAHAYNLKLIVTTDSHYLDLKQKMTHKIFLKSKQESREVDSFYDTTYMMSTDEIRSFFHDDDLCDEMFQNTLEVAAKCENYDISHKPIVPSSHIPEFKPVVLSQLDPLVDWSKYPFIQYYESSESESDRYYLKLIMNGMLSHQQAFNDTNLSRINQEIEVVKKIGDYFEKPMSSYFTAMVEFIDIMWEYSLVGSGRGSSGAFYTNYLLNITQVNAIEYDLPFYRFANTARVDSIFDIDVDTEAGQRENIINAVKDRFGENNVINVGTFSTIASRNAVQVAGRGIGLTPTELSNIMLLLDPKEDVLDVLEDDSKEFTQEVNEYPNFANTIKGLYGIVSGASVHASGVIVVDDGVDNILPEMKTSKGIKTTQWDLDDAEYVGGIKFDFLTIGALDRIHESMNLLLADDKIEWQGNIRDTYDKYLNPNVIDMNDEKGFELLYNNEIPQVFQFSGGSAIKGIQKVQPHTFDDLVATNALIRLQTEDEDKPIDRYVRFRDNINLWYKEMSDYGLTNDEQNALIDIVGRYNGILISQEALMQLVLDERVVGFNMKQANKIRKSIAKKDPVLQAQQEELFMKTGAEHGISDKMLRYTWDYMIEPMKKYSFSTSHGIPYTMIALIEIEIGARYGVAYWKAGSLNVDSGVLSGDTAKHDKISASVNSMRDSINQPNVNTSNKGYSVSGNRVTVGLNAISGLSNEAVDKILEERPFTNLQDVIERTGFNDRTMATLIKSGALSDTVDGAKRATAIEYINLTTPKREKLTTVQLPKIIDSVPSQYESIVELYKVRNMLTGRNKIKDLTDDQTKYIINVLKQNNIEYGYQQGQLSIDEKLLKKAFDKKATPLKDWLKTDEAIDLYWKYDKNNRWWDLFNNNEYHWSFMTLDYYPSHHELEQYNFNDEYGTRNFLDLPEQGVDKGKYVSYTNYAIVGTVVANDSTRKEITLLTTDHQVVTVRVGARYAHYASHFKTDEINEINWFTRGQALVLIGHRRGNDFTLGNRGTAFNHTVYHITNLDKQEPIIVSEKEQQ